MALTYSTYLDKMALLAAYQSASNPKLVGVIPEVIAYAENRIYRDLDLLSGVFRDTTKAVTPMSRFFVLPTAVVTFIAIQSFNIVKPAGVANPENGERVSLTPTSKEFVEAVYPSVTSAGEPAYFAMLDDRTVVLGPWPNLAYQVEIVGTGRPATLSASTPTTFLSTHMEDLFIAASMIFMSGFQRNFGAQADDPRAAMSWEQQYQALLASAATEEARRKLMA